jgi:hypothetical protein
MRLAAQPRRQTPGIKTFPQGGYRARPHPARRDPFDVYCGRPDAGCGAGVDPLCPQRPALPGRPPTGLASGTSKIPRPSIRARGRRLVTAAKTWRVSCRPACAGRRGCFERAATRRTPLPSSYLSGERSAECPPVHPEPRKHGAVGDSKALRARTSRGGLSQWRRPRAGRQDGAYTAASASDRRRANVRAGPRPNVTQRPPR